VHLLVTGAAGIIGADFVHDRTSHHPEDRVVALTYAGNPANREEVRGRALVAAAARPRRDRRERVSRVTAAPIAEIGHSDRCTGALPAAMMSPLGSDQ
jgi:dTDP-D-glucose 4,6-dehydratase